MREESGGVLKFVGDGADVCSVLDAVTRQMDIMGLTQQAVAREADVNPAVFNQWLQGKYTGDNQAVTEKMGKWLAARPATGNDAVAVMEAPRWIETPTAKRIIRVLEYARLMGDVAAIYGGAGLGKTSTIKHYADLFPNVWVATMTPDTAGMASALEEIALTLGLKGLPGRAARLRREIVKRMIGTRGVLVIDEAQHLSVPALETIRSMHDASDMGLVLCGNESVYARLTGGTRQPAFAQLFSRLGKRLCLTAAKDGDAKAICEALGVTDAKAVKYLCEIAKNPGALRSVVKTIRLSSFAYNGTDEGATLERVAAAWDDLAGEG